MSGLASTTAAGLARRITPAQWEAVERGLPAVTGRVPALLPAPRADALAGGPVTIDLDTTEVEVYGRKNRGVACNPKASESGGRTWPPELRQRLSWPPTWATAPMTRARPRRICCAAPWPACRRARASGRVALRADAGYFAGALARVAHEAHIGFAIGAKRIAPLWRLLAGIAEDDWHDATGMDGAQVAVAEYCPDWWPANAALLVRRVLLDPAQVSADPRSRRRRTLHPDQRALPFPELARAGGDLRLLLHPDQPGCVQPQQGDCGRALVPAPHHGGEHFPRQQARCRSSASPVGIPQVNLAWMWGALLAATMAAWLHQLTAATAGEDILHGHGVRGGKVMIATCAGG